MVDALVRANHTMVFVDRYLLGEKDSVRRVGKPLLMFRLDIDFDALDSSWNLTKECTPRGGCRAGAALGPRGLLDVDLFAKAFNNR